MIHPDAPVPEVHARARKIKLLLLDVDGVLTDGRLHYSEAGVESKAFNILDGLGVKLLQKSGVQVGIVTGRSSELVRRRAEELSIEILIQKCPDKGKALETLCHQHTLLAEEVAFMGDDYPDLPAISRAGLALTVANAHPEVAARCHWQSELRGGEGAVRAACDFIMQAQGTYEAALAGYLA